MTGTDNEGNDGKTRYILERVVPILHGDVGAPNAGAPNAAPLNAAPFNAGALNAAPNAGAPNAECADDDSTKRPTVVVLDSGRAKRACNVVPSYYSFGGYRFDSLLEAQHAAFYHSLGLANEPHAATFTLRYGGKEFNYTPDFFLPTVGKRGTYVEIKPARPHEVEWLKAEGLAMTMKVNVLLLYGKFDKGLPFASEDAGGARHYRHNNSIRGILWCPGKRRKDDLVWCMDAVKGPFCDSRLEFKDNRWAHPSLLAAYSAAKACRGDRSQ